MSINESVSTGTKSVHSFIGEIFTEDEEHRISRWIMELQSVGFRLTKRMLFKNAELNIKNRNQAQKFHLKSICIPWYERFIEKYPEISLYSVSNPDQIKTNASQWSLNVQKYLASRDCKDILENPLRIFSMTELAFALSLGPGEVVEKRGYSETKFKNSEQVTAFVGGSAAGIVAPPMILFDRMRLRKKEIEYKVPPSWTIGGSETGWMTASSLYEYIVDTFHPWLLNRRVPLPIVLFLDGFHTHVTQTLTEFCDRGKIILVGLPSETYVVQPMDLSLTGPLLFAWRDVLTVAPGNMIAKEDFCSALYDVIEKIIDIDLFKSGFKASGVYPFRREAVKTFKKSHTRFKMECNEKLEIAESFSKCGGLSKELPHNLKIDTLVNIKEEP